MYAEATASQGRTRILLAFAASFPNRNWRSQRPGYIEAFGDDRDRKMHNPSSFHLSALSLKRVPSAFAWPSEKSSTRSGTSLYSVYCSQTKMRRQSLFMLMTVQPFERASSYSAWVKVPTLESGNP